MLKFKSVHGDQVELKIKSMMPKVGENDFIYCKLNVFVFVLLH